MIYLGIDDTDSHRGGCTTHVAYLLAKEIIRTYGDVFADYPRLIRLNPTSRLRPEGTPQWRSCWTCPRLRPKTFGSWLLR
ncbi:hypothetical protein [Thermoproteus tenax]|uniref:hypothetical protein n=1 Tax=Thermoproteus tenax TaxID=2271 RepID=UPI003B836008